MLRFAACLLLTGCASLSSTELFNPGTAGLQQARALEHDPYPSPDVGPDVLGGRPRGYTRPTPEPTWLQQNAPVWRGPPGPGAP